jgi:hypothetical protein
MCRCVAGNLLRVLGFVQSLEDCVVGELEVGGVSWKKVVKVWLLNLDRCVGRFSPFFYKCFCAVGLSTH